MAQQLPEGAVTFAFPDAWTICRPEECTFYSKHFQSFCGGAREMDFLAYDPAGRVLWLVEVKDYRSNARGKDMSVWDEIALKTRDSLALLPAAGANDHSSATSYGPGLREFWQKCRSFSRVRVVLHCELPDPPSKLFPGVKDAANIAAKLRWAVRVVDPHALVTSMAMPACTPWQVTPT